MNIGKLSDVGLVRKLNEDRFVADPPHLFVVADGMGGHEAGEVASAMAVSGIVDFVHTHSCGSEDYLDLLTAAIQSVNDDIYDQAQQRPECHGMGTTTTVVYLMDDLLYYGHVGDSRVYLFRNGEGKQLTRDHSLVGELVRSGEITVEDAKQHPQRNILTQAVGVEAMIQVDAGYEPWLPGDVTLLCTDGLSNMLSMTEMSCLLAQHQTMQQAAEAMIGLAKERGGSDNITVVIIQHG